MYMANLKEDEEETNMKHASDARSQFSQKWADNHGLDNFHANLSDLIRLNGAANHLLKSHDITPGLSTEPVHLAASKPSQASFSEVQTKFPHLTKGEASQVLHVLHLGSHLTSSKYVAQNIISKGRLEGLSTLSEWCALSTEFGESAKALREDLQKGLCRVSDNHSSTGPSGMSDIVRHHRSTA